MTQAHAPSSSTPTWGDRTPSTTDEAQAQTPAPAVEVEAPPDDEMLDHGVEESFPASDPVSVAITKIEKPSE